MAAGTAVNCEVVGGNVSALARTASPKADPAAFQAVTAAKAKIARLN